MNSLTERDGAAVWHPATHFGDLEQAPPVAVARARGSWLFAPDGRAILDGVSSWWTTVHGHCHPHIVAAIAEQAEQLDHVMFAGFTHAPAVRLAEALLAAAPAGYGKVFFADCGSAAVEVAMKMSFQARVQCGEPHRRRLATLRNSYHGETLGALALCGSPQWREPFGPLLHDPLLLPFPDHPRHEDGDLHGSLGADDAACLEAIATLEAHAHEVTAVVVEPLIQCAGRMAMPGVGAYRRLCEHAQRLGIHVIADEIAVAFGRTGRLFASQWADVTPDFLCLSKGLSGGVLPLSAVLIRQGFEQDFQGHPSRSFLHSHTFTGNPIACAAALASLDIFEREQTLQKLPLTISFMADLRQEVASACPQVANHRQLGTVVAFDVVGADGRPCPADARIGLALRMAALERGVLLRPLHDTIYWMPPLTVTADELRLLARVTSETIHAVLR